MKISVSVYVIKFFPMSLTLGLIQIRGSEVAFCESKYKIFSIGEPSMYVWKVNQLLNSFVLTLDI